MPSIEQRQKQSKAQTDRNFQLDGVSVCRQNSLIDNATTKGSKMNTTRREYTAMTQSAKGGTQAVTIVADDESDARAKLARLGYHRVLWVI